MLGGANEAYMAREYSEDTQKYVDEEIARIVDERYAHVLGRLREENGRLTAIAERLLEKETLDEGEFAEMTGAKDAGGGDEAKE